MSVDVLVVLDFFDSHQTLRNEFSRTIAASGWRHHPTLPNAYCNSFRKTLSDDQVTAASEACMSQAAAQSGLEQWDAVCIIGDAGWLAAGIDQCTAQPQ